MAKAYTSLSEIQNALRNNEITVEGLVKNYLAKINENAYLNAFNEVFADEAVAFAKLLDDKIKNKTAGKLAAWLSA